MQGFFIQTRMFVYTCLSVSFRALSVARFCMLSFLLEGQREVEVLLVNTSSCAFNVLYAGGLCWMRMYTFLLLPLLSGCLCTEG
jgi:hypothetical protein